MSIRITFFDNNCFVLTYLTRCADGNGWTNPCTIKFLFSRGRVIAKSFKSTGDTSIILVKDWAVPKKRIEYVCKFLKKGKRSLEKKLKDKKDKNFILGKLSNYCNYGRE